MYDRGDNKVHHGKIREKRNSCKSLPLVQSPGKSQSHLKDSFQGKLESEDYEEEEVV